MLRTLLTSRPCKAVASAAALVATGLVSAHFAFTGLPERAAHRRPAPPSDTVAAQAPAGFDLADFRRGRDLPPGPRVMVAAAPRPRPAPAPLVAAAVPDPVVVDRPVSAPRHRGRPHRARAGTAAPVPHWLAGWGGGHLRHHHGHHDR